MLFLLCEVFVIFNLKLEVIMAKERDARKETKKEPTKSLKEKRLEKKEKKKSKS